MNTPSQDVVQPVLVTDVIEYSLPQEVVTLPNGVSYVRGSIPDEEIMSFDWSSWEQQVSAVIM